MNFKEDSLFLGPLESSANSGVGGFESGLEGQPEVLRMEPPEQNELYAAVQPYLPKDTSGPTEACKPPSDFVLMLEKKLTSFCKRKTILTKFGNTDLPNADIPPLAKEFAKEHWPACKFNKEHMRFSQEMKHNFYTITLDRFRCTFFQLKKKTGSKGGV